MPDVKNMGHRAYGYAIVRWTKDSYLVHHHLGFACRGDVCIDNSRNWNGIIANEMNK